MGLFDHFPYTNFHELNLTWILNALKEIQTTMDQFVAINALKYADPIQWNIVRQYEKNTIVIDPLTGTAYISVQPVPSGVIITNTDYWTVVFDLGAFVVRAAKNFTDKYEDATTLTATFPSNVNDWLIWGDTLYRVISSIVAGDQYVEGSNIVHFTAEDVIGHIQDLNTTDKSNLVAAINEVDDHTDTNTSNITSIFNILNNRDVFNVKDYGATGDGVTDDTDAITDTIAAMSSGGILYFPTGNYLYSDNIFLISDIIVFCNNTEFKAGAPKVLFVADETVSNILFMGSAKYDADGLTTGAQTYDYRTNGGFLAIGSPSNADYDAHIVMDMKLEAYGMYNAGHIIAAHHAKYITIKGNIFTNDSTLFFGVGCSNLEICNLKASYIRATPPDPVIMDNDVDLVGHTFEHVNIHDCDILGNGYLELTPINIGRSNAGGGEVNPEGAPFDIITDVKITNCTIQDINNWGDGIDVLETVNAVISDCIITSVNVGIVVCATAAVIQNNVIQSCRNLGIQLGDPGIGYNWAFNNVKNNILINNGLANDPANYKYPANMGIASRTGYNISEAIFEGNQCVTIGNTLYGFYMLANTSGSHITVQGNRLTGNTAPFYSAASGDQLKLIDNDGLNPRGIVTPVPTVSTVPVTNNYGTPVRIFINNAGAIDQALMLNGAPVAALKAGDAYEYILDVGETTAVSTDPTDVSWSWWLL